LRLRWCRPAWGYRRSRSPVRELADHDL
jgi:hypothetical protein